MPATGAKQTDRLVFRVPPSLYAALSGQADLANRSVNGELCTAVDKWLYERDELVLIKDRLLASASPEAIDAIRRSTPTFLHDAEKPADERCKTNVRFKDKVDSDLRAAWEGYKLSNGRVSLNGFLEIVVSWWLIYSFQVAECAKALHREFKNSIRPNRGSPFTYVPTISNVA